MNRERLICIFTGIFILAGMISCPPVSIQPMSLYRYAGDTNAGLNLMTFYRFMPEGWPRCINYGVLLWQCFFLCVIIFCIAFALRKDIRKSTHDIKKSGKMFSFILIFASIMIFLLWLVIASLRNYTLPHPLLIFSQGGLWISGLLGLLAAFMIVNVYVDKKLNSQLLNTTLLSCTLLTYCMIRSLFWIIYSPDFQITPNMWKLIGVLAFLGVWVFYVIYQFILKNMKRQVN